MGWDACTLEPSGLLRWIECHPASVNAIQDAGLLVTIGIAIAVPVLDRLRARRELKLQSQAFLVGLLPALIASSADMNRVLMMTDELRNKSEMWPGLPGYVRSLEIAFPPALETALAEMYVLDNSVVRSARSAIMAIQSFNATVERVFRAVQANPQSFASRRDATVELLTTTAVAVRDQLRRVVPSRERAPDNAQQHNVA